MAYTLFFLLMSFSAILESVRGLHTDKVVGFVSLIFAAFVCVIMVGFRHQVGADWTNYEALLLLAEGETLTSSVLRRDPAYGFLNWFSANYYGGLYLVNTVAACFFTFGLFRFLSSLSKPHLAMCVAFPYLILVVAMGYTRQSVAIGFCLMAICNLFNGRSGWFLVQVLAASAFHSSAFLMMGLLYVAEERSRRKSYIIIAFCLTFALLFPVISTWGARFITLYIESGRDSSGAIVRIAMNALAGAVFLVNRRRFFASLSQNSTVEVRVWTTLAVIAVVSFAALFITPSTTAIDRIGLYLIPLQIFVLSRLPDMLVGPTLLWTLVIILYSGLVLSVWLLFADYSSFWFPYQNYIVNSIFEFI